MDDDFWTTYIAATPDEDPNPPQGCSGWLWAIVALIVAALLAVCL